MTIPREVTTSEALQGLRDLLDGVHGGEHVTLTRRGQPVAVVVDVGWYERHASTPTALAKDNPVRLSGEVLWMSSPDLVMRLLTEVFHRADNDAEARIEALNTLLNEAVTEFLDRNAHEDE